MTRLEQSEHEVHGLREEIRTRPHGGAPEEMRLDSHVIGELQRKLESLEDKYQLLKHAGTPQVNPTGIPTPKPEPRVRVFGVPAREARVAGSLPGFGFPPPRMTGHPCGRMNGVSGVEPHEVDGVGPARTRYTSRLAWGALAALRRVEPLLL